MNKVLTFAIGTWLVTVASAQHSHQSPQHPHQLSTQHSPYTGFENRQIKSLSQPQIEDLKAGKGMSLALAAELNAYPGPAHSLELADQLKLTEAQKNRIQDLFKAMSDEAKMLGIEVIDAEQKLDSLFKTKSVNASNLKEATLKAGQAYSRLRESHLRYHLLTTEVLSQDQIESYSQLRGY